MAGVVEYYTSLQGVRTRLTGLPGWARLMLFIASLPGIALIALSILAFLVSLAALLLLTVPLYRLLKLVTGTGRDAGEQTQAIVDPFDGEHRKRVDATVVDPTVVDATDATVVE
jgi:hypothetical protein